jgi:O-acetyl-ADP-ribose deacetylase (regulator of RNase III)
LNHILHAVDIDPFYGSSVELVEKTLETALGMAQSLGAKLVSMPMLATGFGPLDAHQFANAVSPVLRRDWAPVEQFIVVVRRDEDAEIVKSVLAG